MFSVSTSDPLHRESKSSRAGLNLHVGRFHRWMIDVRLGRFVHEFAAIHLTASMENLIEEILGQSLNNISINSNEGTNPILTAALLDKAISNNGDLWGLLQPYAHLNSGRTSSGKLL
jgi:ankyrin repeat/BTB/POZ domain-containing protein 2